MTAYNTILTFIPILTQEEKVDLIALLKSSGPKKSYRSGQLIQVKVSDGNKIHGIIVGGGKTIKIWAPSMCKNQFYSVKVSWESVIKSYEEVFFIHDKMPTEDTMKKLKDRFKDEK